MTVLTLARFGGEIPRVLPQDLPEWGAQYALDIDTTRGDLRGLRTPVASKPNLISASIHSIFSYDKDHVWAFAQDVDAVRGPVVDDSHSRFYYIDSAGLAWCADGTSSNDGATGLPLTRYRVGVPQPDKSKALSITTVQYELPTIYTRTSAGGANLYVPANPICDFDFFIGAVSKTDPGGSATNSSQVYVNPNRGWRTYPFYSSDPTTSHVSGNTVAASSLVSYGNTAISLPETGNQFGELSAPKYRHPSGYEINYVHLDYAGAPMPAVILSDVIDGEFPTSTTYYHLGNGWYSNTAGAPKPVDTLSSSSSDLIPCLTISWYVGATRASASVHYTRLLLDSPTQCMPGVSNLDDIYATFSRMDPTDAYGDNWQVVFTKNSAVNETRAYSFTYVNGYGEESSPAAPAFVDISLGDQVVLDFSQTGPEISQCGTFGNGGWNGIQKVRIYRTVTGSAQTIYDFVKEAQCISQDGKLTTVTDDVASDRLGPDQISTFDYLPPPDGMSGLCVMANGVLAAFKSNEVRFCEPYLPYAWKQSSTMTFPYAVKGIKPTEGGLHVTTTAYPYYVSGVTPDSMMSTKINAVQAGVSKRSICDMGTITAYASNDGIVVLSGISASLDQSLRFFTREEWRSRYSALLPFIRFTHHDGKLLATFDNGQPGFMIDFDESSGSFVRLSASIVCTAISAENDAVFYASGSGTVFSYNEYSANSSARYPFQWQSKRIFVDAPINFGVMEVIGSGNATITMSIEGGETIDGVPINHTVTVNAVASLSGTKYRLPSGFLYKRFSVTISPTDNITPPMISRINLAVKVEELKGV